MNREVIFATKNKHKMIEINEIMADSGIQVISMEDVGIDIDVIEDGLTFEENAIKKAVEIMKITNKVVLADDSGLEVDYINKEPGIYSARYGGADASYHIKNQMIIERLVNAKGDERSARFVCVIAVAYPDGQTKTVRGTIEGLIDYDEKGTNGFGYDPIFYVPQYGCTTAEMAAELKNTISHRGKALEAIKEPLKAYFDKQ